MCPDTDIVINRIYWCIHPYCCSMYDEVPEGRDPELFRAFLQWELKVHDLQMAFVSDMRPDEALIVYPIGESEPMRRLTEHAERTLGRRFVLVTWQCAGVEFLRDVADPIRRFLEDEELPGRQEFLHDMLTDHGRREEPAGIADEVEAEVREGCAHTGYGWDFGALKVPYGNRVMALDIAEKFRTQRLVYNPESVECLAFGEGFEQCAMTWKAMLPHYLGLAKPIENDFGLSASGAPLLIKAKFRERVALSEDVRLFLWEGEGGRPVAFYCRAAARMRDPQLFAYVPLQGFDFEVRDVANKKYWPADDPSPAVLKRSAGRLGLPVMAGLRRGPADRGHYMIAEGISFEEFRSRLVNAEITPDADHYR